MIEKRVEEQLLFENGKGKAHGGDSRFGLSRSDSGFLQSVNRS